MNSMYLDLLTYFSQCIICLHRNSMESMNCHDCSYRTEQQVTRKLDFFHETATLTFRSSINSLNIQSKRRKHIGEAEQFTSLVVQIPRFHFLSKDQHSHVSTPKNVILSYSVVVALSSQSAEGSFFAESNLRFIGLGKKKSFTRQPSSYSPCCGKKRHQILSLLPVLVLVFYFLKIL